MALPPRFAAHRLELSPPAAPAASVAAATHTLELYLDYCCPFSARLFTTFTREVAAAARRRRPARGLAVVFRHQVQPWHPSSTLMHEAALAVLRLAPAAFWDFSAALFSRQVDFLDVAVADETRNATYRRLARLAADAAPAVDEAAVLALLRVPSAPGPDGALNAGNAVTDDLKLLTKMGRRVGVHITPTVVLDGVVHDVGSAWTLDQWDEWLAKHVE